MRVIVLGITNCGKCRALNKYCLALSDMIDYTYIELKDFTDMYLSESDMVEYIKVAQKGNITVPYALYQNSEGKWLPFVIDDLITKHYTRFRESLREDM
jgi:hypothetical protein